MQITLQLRGRLHDVDVAVDRPDARVADLLRVVAPGADGAGLVVDGRWLAPDDELAAAGLYDGAIVAVGGPPEGPRPSLPVAEGLVLAVVGGPHAGAAVPLPQPGSVVLGRGAGADLVLADPSLSGRHASIEVDAGGRVTVADLDSTNGTTVDGRPVDEPVGIVPGALIEIGATQLRVRTQGRADRPVAVDPGPGFASIPFNRPPRPAAPRGATPMTSPDAPLDEDSTKVPFSIIAIIGPLVFAGVMIAVTGSIRFALFGLLSPVMAIGNYATSKRRAKKALRSSAGKYRRAVDELERDLAAGAVAERERREALLPDPAEVLRRALLPSVALWQRRPAHDDFLRLRAGAGTVPWAAPVEPPRGAGLPPEVRELVARHAQLPRSPVPVDLRSGQAVGIVGDRAVALALARCLVAQAAVHHGPADSPMVVLAAEEAAADWDWVKWLPHVRDASGTSRTLAGDREAADALLGALSASAPQERAPRVMSGTPPPAGPTRLYVIDDVTLMEGRRAKARELLRGSAGPAAGIVLAPTEDRLPAVCSTVITVAGTGDAVLRRPAEGLVIDDVVIAGLAEPTARAVARALSRFEDPELDLPGSGLPGLVRLPPLLGMDEPDVDAVARAWRNGLPDPGPSTPVGVGEDGVVVLDLKTDGPHGLIGGTTGSGKSELLRSLVAGMAARVDPDHLVFVLVDYKGGSAFDACARLPHTVGMVTDLDEHLGERALRSLEAELRHRERVLRDAGAADLPAYLDAGSPLGPLPRLVVVIDEFATLAGELPDFLGALVGIAQRGRSLGVHLLLATQRPQGSVNANIKANTNLRIALRVQDDGDSRDIIDRGDAAAISRATPGRAYVRRGPGEVELVQTALATAAAGDQAAGAVRAAAFRFGPSSAPPATVLAGDDGRSDLDDLVTAITGAYDEAGLAPPRRPWLEMLPEAVTLDEVLAAPSDQPGVVPFGLGDDPDGQRRVPVGWVPADGHLALFGAVGSGTTTTALALAAALADRERPDRVHIYGIDYGPGGLAPLAFLPHTGAVLAASEREAQIRLLRLLRSELDRRRDLPAAALTGEPMLLTVIDGVGAFLGEFDAIENAESSDTFKRLVADGPSVGILFVLLADRTGALPLRLGSSVGQRALFKLADPNDYTTIGLRRRALPAFLTGRCVHGPSSLVTQVGHPGDLEARGAAARERWGANPRPPTRVGTLPATVAVEELPPPAYDGGTWRLPLGIAEDDLTPAVLEVRAGEHLVVAGPPRSGVPEAMGLIAAQLRATDPRAVLVALCEERSVLFGHEALDAAGTVADLRGVLAKAPVDDRPWWVLVEDTTGTDDLDGVLARLLSCRRPGLHVVAASSPDDFRRAYTHWSRPVRQSRSGLLLQPTLGTDGDLFGLRLPRRVPVALTAGRGFLVTAGEARLVQIAITVDA